MTTTQSLHFARWTPAAGHTSDYASRGRYLYRLDRAGRRWRLRVDGQGVNLHDQIYATKRDAETVANRWESA